ncbi:hypothetical protein U9Z31_23375 [Escherichia coli]
MPKWSLKPSVRRMMALSAPSGTMIKNIGQAGGGVVGFIERVAR